MLEQVRQTIRRFCLIVPGQRVAVACSGGPDSTALLLVLAELSSDLGCTLSVAHFNHRLRGEQSDQDEQSARDLAERLGLSFHVRTADVRGCAKQGRANVEETARRLRYEFFFSLVESNLADRVAVGHTADDQAETVLHRLLRGTGTRGLAGIYPMFEERIIRPLLDVRRPAVLDWLNHRQQPWRDDPSNRDLRYMRNRIRHQLLPLLAEFNPRVVEILAHTAELARDEEAFWEDYLSPVLAQSLRREQDKVCVEISLLRQMPPAVARRVLRSALRALDERSCGRRQADPVSGLAPPFPSVGSADFDQIQRLLDLAVHGQSGSSLSLPRRLVARKEFSSLVLEAIGPALARFPGFCYPVQVSSVVAVPEIARSFSFELISLASEQARYNENEEDLLDSRIIERPLVLRNWRPGDAYQPRRHWKRRKLKELFQRRRVSSSERERWPVVVADDQVMWSRGWGVAEGWVPRPGSTNALRIRETKW